VRLRENNVAVLERQLQATQDRFSVGEETRTDVAQSESRLAASRAELIAAQGDLSSAIATYVQVIGETPGDVAPPDAPAGLPSALDIATSLARENNPGAISAFFLERAGNDDIDTAQADLLPQLSLRGSYGTDFNSSDSVRRSESALVQGRLTIPLYAGGSEFAQVRRAKQNASRLRSNRVQAEREAVEDATRAWAELRAAEAQIISFQAAIDASQIALEGVRQESLVGSRTVLDVLDAEQELLDAQVDLVGALRDRVVASYELLAAVGALNAETLGLAVDVYDPTVYYDSVRFKAFGLGD
ncbi:MAG: TolC family protein, partial [Pseudomonadota bacterium]